MGTFKIENITIFYTPQATINILLLNSFKEENKFKSILQLHFWHAFFPSYCLFIIMAVRVAHKKHEHCAHKTA